MLKNLSSSLFLIAVLLYGPVQADGLASCAGISLDWVCADGAPVLQATRNAREQEALDYRILNGGRVFDLGAEAAGRTLGPAPRVTVVGLDPEGGPCCLSQ